MIQSITIIHKQTDYKSLSSFLDDDQYTIAANYDTDVLFLKKPLTEVQELLLSIWLSGKIWDTDQVIG